MLKEKLEQRKCFPTAWGKLIPEEEAYRQLNRQIAAMTANLFQVMRIFEPSWEKRTEAICDIANMMNMAVAGTVRDSFTISLLRRSRRIMSMLRSMRRSTSRSCAKSRAGSAASPATPATSGRTWRAASCSSHATVWKRSSTPARGTLSAVSSAT